MRLFWSEVWSGSNKYDVKSAKHTREAEGVVSCDCIYNQLKECALEYRFKKLVQQQFFHFTRVPQTGDAGVMITLFSKI